MASDDLSALLVEETAKEQAAKAAKSERPKVAYHAPTVEPPKPKRIKREDALKRLKKLSTAGTTAQPPPSVDAALVALDEETRDKGEDERKAQLEAIYGAAYNGRKRVGDFAAPLPDSQNPNAIFKTRYLRRGHTLLFVSILGLGKSTLVSQASECWAIGKPFYGIEPAHPLKIGVFETEDDDDEVADFRDNFRKGFDAAGWTADEIRKAETGKNAPIYYPMGDRRTGAEFLDYLEYCQSKDKNDLIIINPVYDFVGGDISKQAIISEWKGKLDRLASKYGFALLLVHHTNRVPTNKKDRDEWCGGASAAYAGSGSMVLPSSSRAVIFMRPIKDGFVALEAAKRGRRLGWLDANGDPTTTKYLAHSDGFIYWREPTPEEVAENGVKDSKPKHPHNADIITICEANGKPYESVRAITEALCAAHGKTDTAVSKWLNYAVADKVIVKIPVEGSQSVRVGLPSQFADTDTTDAEEPEPWFNK